MNWFKSSYSGDQGECIEVAVAPSIVHVRDSKDITRPGVTASPDSWSAFIHLIRADSKALAVEAWSTRS
ncbi:DUF397 domain-containing protein [Streptomyces ochraceiscleroticus]|uniref:DUF397 domain-containing protein n=1 Tax=Streptomyces ochraceiscleroticus TaxID=47761 RepID=A0ABW1MG36_9ACTN|nr:DUF397 domain-containing protein [Streptomyces ochraceiscleroticus]